MSEQPQVTLRSVGVVMSKNAESRLSRPGRKRAERPTRAAKIRRWKAGGPRMGNDKNRLERR